MAGDVNRDHCGGNDEDITEVLQEGGSHGRFSETGNSLGCAKVLPEVDSLQGSVGRSESNPDVSFQSPGQTSSHQWQPLERPPIYVDPIEIGRPIKKRQRKRCLVDASEAEGEDVIGKRTRAHVSLASVTLEELEEFLVVSDEEDYFLHVDDEQEYQKFLEAVGARDGPGGTDVGNYEEDEDEDDEDDFDFELQVDEGLARQLARPPEANSPHTMRRTRAQGRGAGDRLLGVASATLRPLMPYPSTGEDKFAHAIPLHPLRHWIPPPPMGFTAQQVGQLHAQVYAHTQLLIQVHALVALEPAQSQVAEVTESLLTSLGSARCTAIFSSRRELPDYCFLPPDGKQIEGRPTTIKADGDTSADDGSKKDSWHPVRMGPTLSVLDVAPLAELEDFLRDLHTAQRRLELLDNENEGEDGGAGEEAEVFNPLKERVPLIPLNCPCCTIPLPLPAVDRGASLVPEDLGKRRRRRRCLGPPPGEDVLEPLVLPIVAGALQRFHLLFDRALIPRKPASGRGLSKFCEAEDRLLAMGVELFNTNWEAIQQRFLPAKSAHQIFVRFKNRCVRNAPSNPVRLARERKMAPLTEEERQAIEEGLRAHKHDWAAVARLCAPHRDPLLLPTLWRMSFTDPMTTFRRRRGGRGTRGRKVAAAQAATTESERTAELDGVQQGGAPSGSPAVALSSSLPQDTPLHHVRSSQSQALASSSVLAATSLEARPGGQYVAMGSPSACNSSVGIVASMEDRTGGTQVAAMEGPVSDPASLKQVRTPMSSAPVLSNALASSLPSAVSTIPASVPPGLTHPIMGVTLPPLPVFKHFKMPLPAVQFPPPVQATPPLLNRGIQHMKSSGLKGMAIPRSTGQLPPVVMPNGQIVCLSKGSAMLAPTPIAQPPVAWRRRQVASRAHPGSFNRKRGRGRSSIPLLVQRVGIPSISSGNRTAGAPSVHHMAMESRTAMWHTTLSPVANAPKFANAVAAPYANHSAPGAGNQVPGLQGRGAGLKDPQGPGVGQVLDVLPSSLPQSQEQLGQSDFGAMAEGAVAAALPPLLSPAVVSFSSFRGGNSPVGQDGPPGSRGLLREGGTSMSMQTLGEHIFMEQEELTDSDNEGPATMTGTSVIRPSSANSGLQAGSPLVLSLPAVGPSRQAQEGGNKCAGNWRPPAARSLFASTMAGLADEASREPEFEREELADTDDEGGGLSPSVDLGIEFEQEEMSSEGEEEPKRAGTAGTPTGTNGSTQWKPSLTNTSAFVAYLPAGSSRQQEMPR